MRKTLCTFLLMMVALSAYAGGNTKPGGDRIRFTAGEELDGADATKLGTLSAPGGPSNSVQTNGSGSLTGDAGLVYTGDGALSIIGVTTTNVFLDASASGAFHATSGLGHNIEIGGTNTSYAVRIRAEFGGSTDVQFGDGGVAIDVVDGDLKLNAGAGVNSSAQFIYDEDDMASNSPAALASQQSIKTYVDARSIPFANAEMFADNITDSTSCATAGVFYVMDVFTNSGPETDANADATADTITINTTGRYHVNISLAGGGSANTDFHIAVFRNGTKEARGSIERSIGTTSQLGAMAITFNNNFAAGDVLDIRVSTDGTSKQFTTNHISWCLNRIE